MSLTVVITPFTVTVATAVLDEDQLKFPLPPVAYHEYPRTRVHIRTRLTLKSGRVNARNTSHTKGVRCSTLLHCDRLKQFEHQTLHEKIKYTFIVY